MLRFLGTTVRLIVILVVVVALLTLPLVTIYRSKCTEQEGEERSTRWSFVLPWKDPQNGDCGSHQNGFEVLRDELGLD